MVVKGPGRLTMTFEPVGGAKQEIEVFNFKGPGVALSMYNTDEVRTFFFAQILSETVENIYNFA
jgi:isocitrate dehydrogenase